MNENQKAELEQAGELINDALAEDSQAPADDGASLLDETGRGQPFQPSTGE